jgi:phage terminase large subunit GpA-like protein
MDSLGEWRATAEFSCTHCDHDDPQEPDFWDDNGHAVCRHCGRSHINPHRGMHVWAGYSYSPNTTWRHLVDEFYDSKDDPQTLKTFVNTTLGETWDNGAKKMDSKSLYNRREHYAAEVPDGGLVLTAGVDTQDDRLECEVVAYGLGYESWSVANEVFHGDTKQAAVWKQLDDLLLKPWTHQSGVRMHVAACCIDQGGHSSTEVRHFCSNKEYRRVFPIYGKAGFGVPLVGQSSRKSRTGVSAKAFPIGVDDGKAPVYARLAIESEGSGYCHFPDTYDQEFFDQLVSEKLVTTY